MDAKKERALTVLAAGGDVEQAGQAAGVRRETIWRWSKTEEFQVELARRQAELDGAAMTAMLSNVGLAAQAITAALSSVDVRVRLQAAKFVFTTVLQRSRERELPERIVATIRAEMIEIRQSLEAIDLLEKGDQK